MSAAERVKCVREASSVELANELAVQGNKRMNKQVAQYLPLNSSLF